MPAGVRADERPSPAVTTDAKDYRPGEIVTITGFSFLPGEVVTIAVQAPARPDRLVESVADASGSFTNTDFSPDEGDVQDFIKIVATGSQSGADRAAIGYFYDSTPAGPCPYVVDSSLAASAPLTSKFKTIQEAITALPNPGPCTINIKAGTYTEAVLIDQVNSAAGASSAKAVVIQADPSNAGPVIVTAPGPGTNATTSYAFSFQRSNFVTLTGFTIAGSARSAIRLIDSVSPKNADITIEGNDIANNNPTGASIVSGVGIGTGQARIWVVNNLIRNNGRMGIDVATSTGPIYIINNTIVGNISGGVARATNSATVSLVNNLIVGNGTASPGIAATCACGLSGISAAALTVKNNMFYANGNGSISSTDIKDAATVLDAGDSNNYVTCTGAGTGCTAASPAIVACTFAGCSNTHAASTEIFVGASDFHLRTTAPISPAIDRGLGSFPDPVSGPDWVPAIDFDGNARPQDGDSAGGAAVDIGFHEVVATVQSTSTSVSSSASGNTSSYGDLVTFTAVVTSGASPVVAGSRHRQLLRGNHVRRHLDWRGPARGRRRSGERDHVRPERGRAHDHRVLQRRRREPQRQQWQRLPDGQQGRPDDCGDAARAGNRGVQRRVLGSGDGRGVRAAGGRGRLRDMLGQRQHDHDDRWHGHLHGDVQPGGERQL